MSDGSHSNAVRLQALALIVAALLTTTGAVTSAFIQSGWFKKPAAAVAMDAPQTPRRAQAMFTGGIEPLEEASVRADTGPVTAGILERSETVPATFYKAVTPLHVQTQEERAMSLPAKCVDATSATAKPRMEAPRVLPAESIAKPLMSTRSSWLTSISPAALFQSTRSPTAGVAKPNAQPSQWSPRGNEK